MRKRLQGIIIGLIVGAFLAGGVAYAVTVIPSDPADRFFACVSTGGVVRAGTIKLNTQPASCANATDTVRSWNSQGANGAQGAPGLQGPPGQASVVAFPGKTSCPELPTVSTTDAAAPPTAFLAIPSIPGEVPPPTHAGEIAVNSYSWGTVPDPGQACGAATSGASAIEFTIGKHLDKASPPLMLATAKGTNLGTVVLSVAKNTGAGSVDYLVITLEDVIISSDQPSSNNGGTSELVTFVASKVTQSYRAQLSDGTFDPPVSTCFDWKHKVDCTT
jgi:Hemolysin-coregulated protein (uncharacterized)